MNIKKQLYKACQEFLNNRLEVIEKTIADIHNSLQSEMKSSAGDKHETGRAMLQLEREKAGHQLAELQKTRETLQKVDSDSKHVNVSLGSVVRTSESNYFIAISAGELIANGIHFYAISPSTPIAQLLVSKRVGDRVQFRDRQFIIEEIQ